MRRASIVFLALVACGSSESETTATSGSQTSSTAASGTGGSGATSGSSSGSTGGSQTSTTTGAGGGRGALPTGQVVDVKPSSECAGCQQMTVQCPGIEDLGAVLEVLEPSATAKGTIFAHKGSGGTQFYDTNVDAYVAAGFRVARVRWLSDWEKTQSAGVLEGACRPATVMQWVFDNVHKADTTAAFCGVGHSGGSGVLAYSLAHYGMDQILDYAALSAGPPFGRIDYGCAPQTYSGPPTSLCPELPNASLALPTKLDTWENTTTCGTSMPSPSDLGKWTADSVVSPGADYDYPNTVVKFWDCATNPNGTTGGAFFYSQQITSEHDVKCFTQCSGEDLGAEGWTEYRDAVLTQCVPRHQ